MESEVRMKNHRMEIKKLIPTIGNEFPESDTSLQITGLKCHFDTELERTHN